MNKLARKEREGMTSKIMKNVIWYVCTGVIGCVGTTFAA